MHDWLVGVLGPLLCTTGQLDTRSSCSTRWVFASLFLQAHRETEAHFTPSGMSSPRNQ